MATALMILTGGIYELMGALVVFGTITVIAIVIATLRDIRKEKKRQNLR